MNPVELKIKQRLTRFPEEYAALRNHALKYLKYCSAIDTDETLLIGHMAWSAPLAYAIRLFPSAKKSWFESFKNKEQKKIPTVYRDFLLVANGCFAYGISLYGLAPSMQKSPALLNRQRLECHDLSLANRDWIREYEVEENQFYFGGRAFTSDENIGYFIRSDRLICGLRENGEVVGEWSSFSDLLSDELAAAEQMMKRESPDDWWH